MTLFDKEKHVYYLLFNKIESDMRETFFSPLVKNIENIFIIVLPLGCYLLCARINNSDSKFMQTSTFIMGFSCPFEMHNIIVKLKQLLNRYENISIF